MPPDRPDVLVIGAGVIGLTAAVVLAEAGASVAVWARELPQETTSRAASAMWGGAFGEPADRIPGWAARSLAAFTALAADPATGVHMCRGTLAAKDDVDPPPEVFPGVEMTPRPAPEGFRTAVTLEVPLIDMPPYLDHLLARLEAAGVEVARREVRSLDEAVGAAGAVVNATGLGARELVGDDTVRPVRGAHVVVENPGVEEFFMEEPFGEYSRGFHPHGGVVVLGSTRTDSASLEPDPEEAERIVAGCATIDPRLGEARVVEHRVGLRPVRPAMRLDEEDVAGGRVVHCYGHGGSGVAMSWGCAHEVAERLGR